jgi:hypothetical protein
MRAPRSKLAGRLKGSEQRVVDLEVANVHLENDLKITKQKLSAAETEKGRLGKELEGTKQKLGAAETEKEVLRNKAGARDGTIKGEGGAGTPETKSKETEKPGAASPEPANPSIAPLQPRTSPPDSTSTAGVEAPTDLVQ